MPVNRLGMILRRGLGTPGDASDGSPPSLGSRMDVMLAIAACMPADPEAAARLSLVLEVESAVDSEEPRCIVARGDWGEAELEVVRALCEVLDARFFDAAAGEFVRP